MVSLVVVLPKLLLSRGEGPSVPDDALEAALVGAGAVVLVLVIPAVVSTGASIGQRLVWLRPEWPEDRRPLARSLARAGVVGLPYVAATALDGLPEAVPFALQTAVGIVAIVSALVVAIAVISVPFTRGHRGLSAALTGAELRDSRS